MKVPLIVETGFVSVVELAQEAPDMVSPETFAPYDFLRGTGRFEGEKLKGNTPPTHLFPFLVAPVMENPPPVTELDEAYELFGAAEPADLAEFSRKSWLETLLQGLDEYIDGQFNGLYDPLMQKLKPFSRFVVRSAILEIGKSGVSPAA